MNTIYFNKEAKKLVRLINKRDEFTIETDETHYRIIATPKDGSINRTTLEGLLNAMPWDFDMKIVDGDLVIFGKYWARIISPLMNNH